MVHVTSRVFITAKNWSLGGREWVSEITWCFCFFCSMFYFGQMGVSKNNGIPKSSILIGFSIYQAIKKEVTLP